MRENAILEPVQCVSWTDNESSDYFIGNPLENSFSMLSIYSENCKLLSLEKRNEEAVERDSRLECVPLDVLRNGIFTSFLHPFRFFD